MHLFNVSVSVENLRYINTGSFVAKVKRECSAAVLGRLSQLASATVSSSIKPPS